MPTNFTAAERNRLLRFLRIGRANARNAKSISAHMGYPIGGNQVKTRNLIRECIEYDYDLIGSTLGRRKGFFLIDTTSTAEIDAYLDSLENRARDINTRRSWLIRNWRRSVPAIRTSRRQITY